MALHDVDNVERFLSAVPAGEEDKNNIKCDEKTEVVLELQNSEQQHHTGSWTHSLQETFTKQRLSKYAAVLVKFGKFVGPAGIISVAYIDPDNFQTSISSGVQFKYKLLFIVLISNLIAIFLQVCSDTQLVNVDLQASKSLAVKLGSVTGMDLAQMIKANFPKWLNIFLWFIAEASILATDIGQVIGTAIAINILIPKMPLVSGCALSILDTLFILYFYRPDGSMRGVRHFELFVGTFVLAIFICFCIELSYITNASVGHVLKGYLPSKTIFKGEG